MDDIYDKNETEETSIPSTRTETTNRITLARLMNVVPANLVVNVREYVYDKRLKCCTAGEHYKLLTNNKCVVYDPTWVVYGVTVEYGILTIYICQD